MSTIITVINILFSPAIHPLIPFNISLSFVLPYFIRVCVCVCVRVSVYVRGCQVCQTPNTAVLHVHVISPQSRLMKKKIFPLLQR